MWIVYVQEGPKQILQHSKHTHESEAEAVASELERLGYSVWIEQVGQSSDHQYGVTVQEGVCFNG